MLPYLIPKGYVAIDGTSLTLTVVDDARRASEDTALVPGHGDFHAGNVMVGPRLLDPAMGPITGLLDLDSVGPGRLDDDLACWFSRFSRSRAP